MSKRCQINWQSNRMRFISPHLHKEAAVKTNLVIARKIAEKSMLIFDKKCIMECLADFFWPATLVQIFGTPHKQNWLPRCYVYHKAQFFLFFLLSVLPPLKLQNARGLTLDNEIYHPAATSVTAIASHDCIKVAEVATPPPRGEGKLPILLYFGTNAHWGSQGTSCHKYY